jgi:tetratricopeptide (TPR) repeat protein
MQQPEPQPANPPHHFPFDRTVGGLIANAVRKMEAAGTLEAAEVKPSGDEQADAREKMYSVSEALCEEGNFLQAAPLAMSLAINSPYDGRFYFLTGRAFQRLGVFNVAQTFYEHSMRGGQSALSMYRLAECLAGQGKGKQALEHFDKALELGRSGEEYRAIQDSAMNAIERIRKQSRK